MLLTLNRITSHEKIFQLKLTDDKSVILSKPRYVIRRTNEQKTVSDNILEFTIDKDDSRISISYSQENVYIDFVDQVELNGAGYIYYADRIVTDADGQEIVAYSNEVYGESLPLPLNDFHIDDVETIYDSVTHIPTRLMLSWEEYDTALNNPNVIGFHIYYSLSPKGYNDWNEWSKVKDLTTSGGSDISLISPNSLSATIDVPQLSQAMHPSDIRIAMVAVTDKSQSVLSDVDTITTHNMAGTHWFQKNGYAVITNGTKEDTEVQVLSMKLINPYYEISFSRSTFDKDTFVWCERIKANEPMNNVTTIEYEMGATSEFLEPFDLKYYLPVKSNIQIDVREEIDGVMTSVPYVYKAVEKEITFSLATSKRFEIKLTNTDNLYTPGIYNSTFQETTRKMIKRLPTWFKIRRNPVQSIGAYFLEVFGLEMIDVENMLKYAGEQTHIATLDPNQLCTIYKVDLPHNLSDEDMFAIESDGMALELSPNLSHFLKPPYFLSEEEMIYHNNMFIVDYKEKVLYTRRSFEEKKDAPYGKVWISIHKNKEEEPWYKQECALSSHKLWDFYDEFGLLLDLTRLKGESNEAFKERILDVFKNPSNSSKEGLANGIARELGIRKNMVWEDTTKDLIIKDTMVICNMISMDDTKVPLSDIWFSSDDYIVIKGTDINGGPVNVSYISGLEMHSLNNKKDKVLYNQLFQPNGLATYLLMRYVRRIKDEIPIEWDSFKWNDSYWDAALPENGGVACVPSLLDASIGGFEKYDYTQMV